MPARLRSNRSEKDLRRRSTLDPTSLFKRADKSHLTRSNEHLADGRFAASEDGARPTSTDLAPQSRTVNHNHDNRPPSPPVQDHTPMTRRFSLMRFRHASDSQLSVKAKEHADHDAPPVPAMPSAAPASMP